MKLRLRALCWLLALMAALLVFPEAPSVQAAGTVRALLVGNSEYAHLAGLIGAPYNDALLMERVLTHPALTAQPARVTRRNDLGRAAMLSAIRSAFQGAREGDISYFYYSGHGALSGSRSAYLCPVDAQAGRFDTMISMQELRAALDQVPGVKVVVLDCCYSGAAVSTRASGAPAAASTQFNQSVRTAFADGVQARAAGPLAATGYKVVTASSPGEESYVQRFTQQVGSQWVSYGISCFTAALAQGCAVGHTFSGGRMTAVTQSSYGADLDDDGSVTLSELYSYMNRAMELAAAQSHVLVSPQADAFAVLAYRAQVSPVARVELSQYQLAPGQSLNVELSLSQPVASLEVAIVPLDGAAGPVRLLQTGARGAGTHTLPWDGLDQSGRALPTGRYAFEVSGVSPAGRAFAYDGAPPALRVVARTAPPSFTLTLASERFAPSADERLEVLVDNAPEQPLSQRYDVWVVDSAGRNLVPLAQDDPARAVPGITESGEYGITHRNTYQWDGRDGAGQLAGPGQYAIRVTGSYAGQHVTKSVRFTVDSQPTPRIALNLSAGALKLTGKAKLTVSGSLSAADALTVEVLGPTGDRVALLFSGSHPGGGFSFSWNGRDGSGASVPSGSYTISARGARAPAVTAALTVRSGTRPAAPRKLRVTGALVPGGKLRYTFTLRTAARIYPEVYTESGELVARLASYARSRGQRSASWDGRLEDGAYLAPGRYLLRLNARSNSTGRYSAPVQVRFVMEQMPPPRVTSLTLSRRTVPRGRHFFATFRRNLPGSVFITLYDARGQLVATPAVGRWMGRGKKTLKMFARSQEGKPLSKGLYFLGIRYCVNGQWSAERRTHLKVV